jgi:hypothetical protein
MMHVVDEDLGHLQRCKWMGQGKEMTVLREAINNNQHNVTTM